jgi:hypothetical protein
LEFYSTPSQEGVCRCRYESHQDRLWYCPDRFGTEKGESICRFEGLDVADADRQGMQDNMDATERKIAALLDLMMVLEDATQGWPSGNTNENRAMEKFKA